MSVLTKNIDAYPHSGIRCAGYIGELTASQSSEEVGITEGKKYKVIAIQGYGDVEDVIFVNDKGDIERAADFHFKECYEDDD